MHLLFGSGSKGLDLRKQEIRKVGEFFASRNKRTIERKRNETYDAFARKHGRKSIKYDLPQLDKEVREERSLFDDSHWSWTREVRRTRAVFIVPFVTFFSYRRVRHESDRIMVLFDEQDRVEGIGLRRELQP